MEPSAHIPHIAGAVMTEVAAAALLVAAVAACAQATTGFGFALVAVPLLTVILNPRTAVTSVTVLSAVLAAYGLLGNKRHVRWSAVATMSGTALIGMPIGFLALIWLSTQILSFLIALILFLFTILLIRGLHLERRRSVEAIAGLASGTMLTSTGMNGPPVVAVFQAMRMAPPVFRATLLATFLIQDLLAAIGFFLFGQMTVESLIVIIAGLPGIALGWFVGDYYFARLEEKRFRWIVLTMLVLSALLALLEAAYR